VREQAHQSKLGEIFNALRDVIAGPVLYLPLAFLPHICPNLVVLLALLATISEMMGEVAVHLG
jgi:CDP-diacylglycerol--glycerol-3-phosphate 3-phosphatidyltransferase